VKTWATIISVCKIDCTFRERSLTLAPLVLAYPLTDKAVRNYFLAAPATDQEPYCKRHLSLFLIALYDSAHNLAERILPAHRISYKNMAGNFYRHLKIQAERDKFYGEVIDCARTEAKTKSSQNVGASFQKFENYLASHCRDWHTNICPVIVSMDEIHVLFKLRDEDSGSAYSLYSRLKSVLGDSARQHFCTVFLSTATSISKLAPAKDVAPSVRERDDDLLLPVPFTELPFDAHIIANPLMPNVFELDSVGSLEFTAQFGRPLYAVLSIVNRFTP